MEQALKSGQLPADLDISDDDPATANKKIKVDKIITESEKEANDGTSNVNEEKNDGPADMEQVQSVYYCHINFPPAQFAIFYSIFFFNHP